MNTSKSIFKTNPNYIVRKVLDEYLLVDIGVTDSASNKLMVLNETGNFIWEALHDYLSLDELIARAKKEFNDTNHMLEQQITEFVISLVKIGLIEGRER